MATANSITTQRLFALLRLGILGGDYPRPIFERMSGTKWQDIYNLALEQGVLAFTYDGVRKLDEQHQPELEIKIQWAYNVSHIEKLHKKQLASAQRIVDTFSQHGIETMILKGLSLAALYSEPSHRQSGDIDIYLMGDYERGNKVASSIGCNVKYDYFVHSEFGVDGVNVENHHYFINPNINHTARYIQKVLSDLVCNHSPHPIVSGALMPSAEFATLFLTRHSSWHYAREAIRLRDICDWGVFLNHYRDSIDSATVMQHLVNSGLERYASVITTLAEQVLGISSPLPFADKQSDLSARVLEDILTFENEQKHRKIGFLRTFMHKIRNRFSRKWCYDLVVPDSYWGNIWYSIKTYITHPLAVFRAKL
ncbi:MAG: nucleotidyltransferase family protein [Alistipes sp.]|nr:nucleotidyltransferase family protein [Alistipes sp.]